MPSYQNRFPPVNRGIFEQVAKSIPHVHCIQESITFALPPCNRDRHTTWFTHTVSETFYRTAGWYTRRRSG